MKFAILLVSSIMVLSLITPQLVFAQSESQAAIGSTSANIVYTDINPDDGYQYLLKRLKENIWLAVLSSNAGAKADYYLYLVDIRMAELKYTVDKSDIANIQTASQRYAATAGQASDLVRDKNLTSQGQSLAKIFKEHILVLKSLQAVYGNDELTAGWRFLEDDVNSLKSYLAQLKD